MAWLWWCVIFVLLVLLYLYSRSAHGLFKSLGIPGPQPFPFIGNTFWLLKHGPAGFPKLIEAHGKIVGIFAGHQPNVIVADLDILRDIQVGDILLANPD
jgi:hypothetical protein